MSVTLTELVDSRETTSGDRPAVTLHYRLEGTSDDGTAKTLVENSTPETYDGLKRQSIRLEPVWVDTTATTGAWDVTVEYVAPEDAEPATGESSFSFDTGGGTQHITQSIQTVGSYAPAGKTPPNFKGAISVTERSVEGVDITIPVYHFSETHYLPDSQVTEAYRGILFALTGKVNDAAFKGCAAGECLFLGASGSKRGEDDWEITFRFAASPNRTNIQIGNITVASKKGWEYLWVQYTQEVDPAIHQVVKKPVAVYIEQVYEYGDFSRLGIGV